MPESELRKSFHQRLDEVHDEILGMGQMVIGAIPQATRILLDADREGADYLINADDELDAKAMDAEALCVKLLALQQPVAGDLRAVVAAMRLVGEIERAGDLAVNIAKGARRLDGPVLDARLRGGITLMADAAHDLFMKAIDSYHERDAGLGAALDGMDDRLDQLQRDFIQLIFERHAAGTIDLQTAVQLAVVARFYERIGDHAVNIGERVSYVVTGLVPEHLGAARFRNRRTAEADGLP